MSFHTTLEILHYCSKRRYSIEKCWVWNLNNFIRSNWYRSWPYRLMWYIELLQSRKSLLSLVEITNLTEIDPFMINHNSFSSNGTFYNLC